MVLSDIRQEIITMISRILITGIGFLNLQER